MTDLRVKYLNKKSIKIEKLYIEEWEEEIYVRGLSSTDTLRFSSAKEDVTPEEGLNEFLKVVILSVVDENGKRVFNEADMEALGEQSIGVIQTIANKALELSGMGKKAEKN